MSQGTSLPRPLRREQEIDFVVIGGRRLPIEWADGVDAPAAGHALLCRRKQTRDGTIEFRLYSADPAHDRRRLLGYAAPPNGVTE